MAFKSHVENLVEKLRVQFLLQEFKEVRKEIVASTFLSVGDIIYMHAAKSVLHSLDSVYHSALLRLSILHTTAAWPETI